MPKKGQSSTAVERLNGLRNRSNEQPVKPPRMKRVTDENLESQPKKSKRAAFGDLTNVSFNDNMCRGVAAIWKVKGLVRGEGVFFHIAFLGEGKDDPFSKSQKVVDSSHQVLEHVRYF